MTLKSVPSLSKLLLFACFFLHVVHGNVLIFLWNIYNRKLELLTWNSYALPSTTIHIFSFKRNLILIWYRPVIVKKLDPNYIDYLVEVMASIPLIENHHTHIDDEETRSTLNPNGSPPDAGQRIELEIRIGDIRDNNHFAPGIKKSDFEAYSRLLKSDPDVEYKHTRQLLYYYEICEGGNIRVGYDEATKKCLSSEYKQKYVFVYFLEICLFANFKSVNFCSINF